MKQAAAKRPRTPESLGTVGPYRLEKLIRGGASFATFRAVHERVGHTAWVTMTPRSVEPSPAANEKLTAAAAVLSAAGRDAALGFMELFDAEGRTVVVTQAPVGPSVREVMDEITARVDLSFEHRATLAIAVARALGEVHDVGIVHGSICPENAFLTDRATIKLAGFWDARILAQEAREADRDVPEGGPEERYRSPERIAGKPADRGSDVFSLGAVAYEIITGRHPFAEEHRGESLSRRIRTADAAPSGAGDDVEAVLRKSLQKISSLRHETGARFADDLTTALGGTTRTQELARAMFARLRGKPESTVGPRLEAHATQLAKQLAAVAAAMVLVGGYVALGDDVIRSSTKRAEGDLPAHVKVLARPWADIYVDGERVDTTPVGKPLSLSPGSHEIVFKHPRALDVRRLIVLAPGESVTLDIEMAVERPVDAGVDPSP